MKKTNLIKMLLMSTIMMGAFGTSVFAAGWSTDDGGANWSYYDANGIAATETIKSSGDDRYYLDRDGFMVRDYLLEDYNDAIYYFDDTGKMVKNTWVAVDPTQVTNQMDNPPTIYLYYFGANGKAYKSSSGVIRKSIDGKKYLFNDSGQMLSGWINEQGERYNEFDTEEDPFVGYCYYAGDETDGVLREGWSAYEDGSVNDNYYLKQTLWFYFKSTDNKKVYSENSNDLVKRKVNGNTYAFDYNGVMIQGWDSDMIDGKDTTKLYFSEKEKDTGRMHKKEWIFAVPSEVQDAEDHDQEVSRWFYSSGSGEIYKKIMKKVNKNYFVFNEQGIMKKGICVIDSNTKEFIDCIDNEKTDGKDFIISRKYISTETYNEKTGDDVYETFDDTKYKLFYFLEDEMNASYGKRKIGEVEIPFAENDYTFDSNGLGQKEGYKYKKYYQAGIKLKADTGLGLGLVLLGYSSNSDASGVSVEPEYNDEIARNHPYANPDANHNNEMSDYIVTVDATKCEENGAYPVFAVVDAAGNRVNRSNVYKKDKSGHYWLIGTNASFAKCFEVPIRYSRSDKRWEFKSEYNDAKSGKIRTGWIPFLTEEAELAGDAEIAKCKDVYDKTCDARRNKKCDYELPIDDLYATNFRVAD